MGKQKLRRGGIRFATFVASPARETRALCLGGDRHWSEHLEVPSPGATNMLVLTRKVGERIIIDNHIVLEVLQVKGNRVRLGIQAPEGATILREELLHTQRRDPAPTEERELSHSL